MLAQNFKTAKELDLAGVEVDALVTVLRMLERGDIARQDFHMGRFRHECKTPACICGWAHHISRGRAFSELTSPYGPILLHRRVSGSLSELFRLTEARDSGGEISPAQAAVALRNYLTHGEPRWAEAMAV